jgi:uncharacterized membrane-anchored protein
MKLFSRRSPALGLPGISGVARPPRGTFADPVTATRASAHRAEPGDIIVLDQIDLDRVSGEALVAAQPAAVVNVRTSISGRHPARGASVVVAAGIPLIDAVGSGLLSEVREGQRIRIDAGGVFSGERLLGQGALLTVDSVSDSEGRARAGMGGRLDSVGADAAAFLRTHEALLLEGDGLPDPGVALKGRQVLVVGPGERSAAEVRNLRRWVRERRPLVVGADAGAALADGAGLRLDLVIGEPGEVPARALSRAARVLPEQIPLGLSACDLAVVLAADGGASLIVLAGAPASYDELLDRDRESAAALLAIRLRAGDLLVDAPAVARLQRPAVGLLAALSVAVAGVVVLVAALASVPGGHELALRLRDVLTW